MKKFIVAVVAALALSLCVLPMSVFADDGGDAGVVMGNSTGGGTNIETVAATPISAQAYTGKALTPALKLTDGDYVLVKGVDYTLSYASNTNAGTATITINAAGYRYIGSKTVNFSITKAANSITKYTSKKTLKYKTLKKKSLTFKIAAVDKFKAKKTYKLTKVPKKAKKYIKVSKAGKVTVKKGIKKGTYKIKVQITAPGAKNYKALKVTKQITIKVK